GFPIATTFFHFFHPAGRGFLESRVIAERGLFGFCGDCGNAYSAGLSWEGISRRSFLSSLLQLGSPATYNKHHANRGSPPAARPARLRHAVPAAPQRIAVAAGTAGAADPGGSGATAERRRRSRGGPSVAAPRRL